MTFYRDLGGGRPTHKRTSHSGPPVDLPCGKCIGCRMERSQAWAVRMMHEAQMHSENAFLTLTYDGEHLPRDCSVNKKHFQDFMKRYRKAIAPVPIRFFHCGEYGENRGRPHYHAAIFGHEFKDKELYKETRTGNRLYTSKQLEELWGKGHCIIGDLTYESAGYIARYIFKKQTGDNAQESYRWLDTETGEIHDRQPEYVTMSRKPGIGQTWLQKFLSDVLPCDFVALPNGATAKVPDYYLKQFEKLDPKEYQKVKRKRAYRARQKAGEKTYYRLVARETVKLAQLSQLKRDSL